MPVIVNNTEITDEQVFAEMQFHPAKTREEAMHLAAQALTIRELLLQEAVAKGYASANTNYEGEEPEANDERIEKLLAAEVKTPEPDEDSCRRFYDNNQQKFIHEGEQISFDKAKPIIIEYLTDVSWHTAVSQYIKILVGRAKIAGVQLDFTDSPLVQ
ncbi:MAG TPA: hypothetical protein DIV86_03495 [Alphaproteobacteria bacterium]|nr:hypothetical protein [Alphaproteobacteria bacterium]